MKKIKLTNSKEKAMVDDEDFAFLNQFKWRIHTDGHVVTTVDNQLVYMHDLVTNRKLAGLN